MSFNNLDALYRQVIMDHYQQPRDRGTLDDETVSFEMNNPSCGDRIMVHLDVNDGIVTDIKFEGEGCSISMASASMMTEAVKGGKVDEGLKMSETFSQRSEEHTSELQSRGHLVCRLLLEKKKIA